uniref:BED-type domain-containing protein n=1 Tax=Lactuca sativa TaxID=4236 RepID=A0A9R1WXA1_LACSA|nr:hypothetical protein LSAT_V11C800450880 [Lactuca sativa]
MGYTEVLTSFTKFKNSCLPPQWNGLLTLLHKGLAEHVGGSDGSNKYIMTIVYDIYNRINLDYGFLIWSQLKQEQSAGEEEEEQHEGSPRGNTPPRPPTPVEVVVDSVPTPREATKNQNTSLRDELDPVIDVTNESNEPANDMDNVDEHAKNKGGRSKRSFIWDHFKKVKGRNGKVKCDYCPLIMAGGSKENGTSAMAYHLKNVCRRSPLYKKEGMKKQATLNFKPTTKGQSGDTLASHHFNQEKAMKFLERMCIKDNRPFSIVDDEGFREFVWEINPMFKISSRWTVANDCLSTHEEEQKKLKKILKNQTLSLTTDTWTSVQNFNYLCLTTHWVDDNWTLNKRILNFCQIPNHKGVTIGKCVIVCYFGVYMLQEIDINYSSYFYNEGNDVDGEKISTRKRKNSKKNDRVLGAPEDEDREKASFISSKQDIFLDYCLGLIYGTNSKKSNEVNQRVLETLKELFIQYKKMTDKENEKKTTGSSTATTASYSSFVDLDLDDGYAKYFENHGKVINNTELDIYLVDTTEKKMKGDNFDVLSWWYRNSGKYPILSQIAKDILGMPISTVASESAFSTSGRVINKFRSSLTPKTAEALICTQDWLHSTPSDSQETTIHGLQLQELMVNLEKL